MLAVLLQILKIIGILLLSILGLAVIMLLFLLFVPVRYRISVKRTGLADDPPADVKVRITWLLHILNIHADYPAEEYLKVRIFFLTLIRMPDRKQDRKKARRTEKKSEPPKQGEKSQENTQPEAGETTVPEEVPPKKDSGSDSAIEQEMEEKSPKKNILHTIRGFYDKIRGIIQQIRDKINNMEDTLQSVKANVVHYRSIMESRAFKDSLHLAFGQLYGILKSIAPKKCRIYIEEGMDDPATTAEILAIYGVFYPWLYDRVTVAGNFEEQILKADVFIKGRITVFRIVYAAIRIYFNKQVKSLIRMFKKEDKS